MKLCAECHLNLDHGHAIDCSKHPRRRNYAELKRDVALTVLPYAIEKELTEAQFIDAVEKFTSILVRYNYKGFEE